MFLVVERSKVNFSEVALYGFWKAIQSVAGLQLANKYLLTKYGSRSPGETSFDFKFYLCNILLFERQFYYSFGATCLHIHMRTISRVTTYSVFYIFKQRYQSLFISIWCRYLSYLENPRPQMGLVGITVVCHIWNEHRKFLD